MRAAHINGITIHYALDGRAGAPVLAFSNSLGTDFRIWDGVVEDLSGDYRILRYDKRGHGLSDAPPAPYAMDDHVADLTGLIDHLGLRDVVVVGLSVGGVIAQGLFGARPDLVRALVLMDTAHRIGTVDMWNSRIAAVEKGGVGALSEAILERWFPPAGRHRIPEGFALCANMLERTTVNGYAGTSAALRDTDYTQIARSISVPVMLVVGSQDGSTPPDLVRTTHDLIAGSRFEIIEGSGHLPCVDNPQAVTALIRSFCGAHSIG